jgi:carboxypeptidase Taq
MGRRGDALALAYQNLAAHYRKLGQLAHVSRIVGWDEAVMMPHGAGESRAEAMATLEGLIHELASDPRVADWLGAAEAQPLNEAEKASVREMRRNYVRAPALPARLVEGQSRALLRCEQAWR